MSKNKNFWITISLAHLCITALLGVLLRSKILFEIPGLDFTFVLHGHSHFAFCGWMTLALMTLMIYEILPERPANKNIYTWILAAVSVNAWGMLISFLLQGYSTVSIFFSSAFTLVTYLFSFFFIKDILKHATAFYIKLLSIAAVLSLVLSSAGPFTLAWMSVTHSGTHTIYKNALYTYLHFQYNGFFSLAAFALFFNSMQGKLEPIQEKYIRIFSILFTISVIPALFISYLWESGNEITRWIAYTGCAAIIIALISFTRMLASLKNIFKTLPRFNRNILFMSVIAFLLKSLLQTGTVYAPLGRIVYGDRAIIIGYLHLVLLGFLTLYLLSHLLNATALDTRSSLARISIGSFACAIISNETLLMIQGFGNMLMLSNSLYALMLWIVAIWLFFSALLILISRVSVHERRRLEFIFYKKQSLQTNL
jgi:hypothetical protein